MKKQTLANELCAKLIESGVAPPDWASRIAGSTADQIINAFAHCGLCYWSPVTYWEEAANETDPYGLTDIIDRSGSADDFIALLATHNALRSLVHDQPQMLRELDYRKRRKECVTVAMRNDPSCAGKLFVLIEEASETCRGDDSWYCMRSQAPLSLWKIDDAPDLQPVQLLLLADHSAKIAIRLANLEEADLHFRAGRVIGCSGPLLGTAKRSN
jgi:hypothetical protein